MSATDAEPPAARYAARYAARLTRPDGADGNVWLLAKHGSMARGASETAEVIHAIKPAKVRAPQRAVPVWRLRPSAAVVGAPIRQRRTRPARLPRAPPYHALMAQTFCAQVVLQVDAETFRGALEHHKHGIHRAEPTFVPKAIALRGVWTLPDLAATGKLRNNVSMIPTAFRIALEGENVGQHFGPVIDAALEVGAEIVVADRAQRTTFSRIAARQASAEESERDIELATTLQKRMGPDALAAAEAATKHAKMAHQACKDVAGTKSAGYALIAEAVIHGKVLTEDLEAYRACRALAQELDREYELIAAAPAVRDAGGVAPPAVAAVKSSRDAGPLHISTAGRTVFAERELLFARALQQPSAPGRDVLGVFYAGHVGGIARVWADARSPEADALAAEYMLPTPSDAATSAQSRMRLTALTPVAALGAAGLAARKLAKSARPLRNAALACAAGVAVPVAAYGLASRALGALVEADKRLRSKSDDVKM